MSRKSFDALFIINQDVSFGLIQSIVKRQHLNSICLLSTHLLLPTEKQGLEELVLPCQLTILCFGNFLDDEQMVACDRLASEFFIANSGIHEKFTQIFTREMAYHKNQKIYGVLCQKMDFKQVFYWATQVPRLNLGISYEFWKEIGAINITPFSYYLKKRLTNSLLQFSLFAWGKQVLNYLKLLVEPIEVSILDAGSNRYLFYSLKRLKFKKDVNFKQQVYRNLQFFRPFSKNNKQTFYKRLVEKMNTKQKVFASIPLHQFDTLFNKAEPPPEQVLIFEDAFRPSNYPKYYYVDYFSYGSFVCRDMFDYTLFKNSDRVVYKPFSFLVENYFQQQQQIEDFKAKTIIAMLNHAGDWTAMINRSDTDIIVDCFIDLARRFSQQEFIIRFHPTMALRQHEGSQSLLRMQKEIDSLNLANLSVSNVSLEEDWARGDVFISEYSLSLIDVMRQGKLGIFTNFTRRRSFVQDYIDLGVTCVNDSEALGQLLQAIIALPQPYLKEQEKAMNRYNEQLESFLGTSEELIA